MRFNFNFGAARLVNLLIASASLLTPVIVLAATAPSISGTAATTVVAGQRYTFQPSARDADGGTLVFSVTDKPVWASLDRTTGLFSGTPTLTQAGTYPAIEISVTDGTTRTKLPKFAITVTPGSASGSHAPVISGAPITTVVVGQGYSFQPSATDADGGTLIFSITGKPNWATLNKATGRLTGAPTNAQVGVYEGVELSVSDGTTRAQLPTFAITVTEGAAVSQTATLSWQPPTLNSDGTVLRNLSGYRIVYGSQSGEYTKSITLNNPGLTRYVVESLAAGKYYFALIALATGGQESAPTPEVSITMS
jgi:Putative Ig domain